MSKKSWSKGRLKGVHCVRLDDETHEKAKKRANELKITIKDFIKDCIDKYT